MRRCDSVTLFCPEEKTGKSYTWRRYILHGVSLMLAEDTDGSDAVMYVFDRDVTVLCGGAVCRLPHIHTGCAVYAGCAEGAEEVVSSLPEGRAMRVRGVKRYSAGRLGYLKVTLG